MYTIREDRVSTKRRDYGNSSWAYLQAHDNGMIDAYDTLLDLLDLGENTDE